MRYFIALLALLLLGAFLFSAAAKASFNIGTSIVTTGAKELSPSYNVGYSKLFLDKWVVGVATNAPFTREREVRKNGFKIKQTTTYISASLGKKINKFVPSLVIAGVKSDNSVYLGDLNLSREKTHAILIGGDLTYFLRENVAISAFVVLPDTNFDLKLSSGFRISYYP